jgi:hypothetical protein
MCVGDILSERQKWYNLASANIKKVKFAKHENVEEPLERWIEEQLNVKTDTAIHESNK